MARTSTKRPAKTPFGDAVSDLSDGSKETPDALEQRAIERVHVEIEEAVTSIREEGIPGAKSKIAEFRRRDITRMNPIACLYLINGKDQWRQRNFTHDTTFAWRGDTRIGQKGKILFKLYPSEKPAGQDMPEYVEVSHVQMQKEFGEDFTVNMTDLLGSTFEELLGAELKMGGGAGVARAKTAEKPPEPAPETVMDDWGIFA